MTLVIKFVIKPMILLMASVNGVKALSKFPKKSVNPVPVAASCAVSEIPRPNLLNKARMDVALGSSFLKIPPTKPITFLAMLYANTNVA